MMEAQVHSQDKQHIYLDHWSVDKCTQTLTTGGLADRINLQEASWQLKFLQRGGGICVTSQFSD